MAQVLAPHTEMPPQPLYVAEPLFIHNSFTEAQQSVNDEQISGKKDRKAKTYRPGQMLSESAFVASAMGQQFGNTPFAAMATSNEAHDPGVESDCSTTDTNEALQMGMADGSPYSGNAFMMPNMGMLVENPWPPYAAAGYWMPYASVPPQPEQTWSPQLPSIGSSGHRLGRCKPCAFMHRDGCRSGADCPYCHLCQPGEKQRRKRVMRAMQRNLGSPSTHA